MAISVKGKVAIVTGSTRGIGRGMANALAEDGAKVVIVSRKPADCEAVAKEMAETYGVETLGVAADMTSQAAIDNLVSTVVAKFGCIDILVNNAGSAITKKAEDITEADWDHVMDLDLKSVFFASQAVARQMMTQNSGKIINIGSVMALVADKQIAPYVASKGAVLQLTKALALEWARYNIQVNAICPGYVITDINRETLSDERASAGLLRKIVMRRFGEVEEIADAAVFLGSSASNYMTGQAMIIDGGYLAQ